MPPTVSVIMPYRNKGVHVAVALESVLSQTFSDFELVVWTTPALTGPSGPSTTPQPETSE